MAPGDLTASTPAYLDIGDSAGIIAEIATLNLAAVTDMVFAIPIANGMQVMIFKVERA